jgi:hypothetical protein
MRNPSKRATIPIPNPIIPYELNVQQLIFQLSIEVPPHHNRLTRY